MLFVFKLNICALEFASIQNSKWLSVFSFCLFLWNQLWNQNLSFKNVDFSQVQNVRTMMANQAGNQMVQYSATSSGAVTPGAAGDEVRVDCCLMATDGRSVVTGSSLGPPQVWDMQVIQRPLKQRVRHQQRRRKRTEFYLRDAYICTFCRVWKSVYIFLLA